MIRTCIVRGGEVNVVELILLVDDDTANQDQYCWKYIPKRWEMMK